MAKKAEITKSKNSMRVRSSTPSAAKKVASPSLKQAKSAAAARLTKPQEKSQPLRKPRKAAPAGAQAKAKAQALQEAARDPAMNNASSNSMKDPLISQRALSGNDTSAAKNPKKSPVNEAKAVSQKSKNSKAIGKSKGT